MSTLAAGTRAGQDLPPCLRPGYGAHGSRVDLFQAARDLRRPSHLGILVDVLLETREKLSRHGRPDLGGKARGLLEEFRRVSGHAGSLSGTPSQVEPAI